MSVRHSTGGNRIRRHLHAAISATSTETPRRSSTSRSVRTTTSTRRRSRPADALLSGAEMVGVQNGRARGLAERPATGLDVDHHGKTNQAKGWLQPEWEVDKDLIAKNAARDPSLMTNGTNELDLDHENRPPSMTGSPAQTINLSDTLTLTATATDDGRPKPVPDPDGPPATRCAPPLDCVPGCGQGAVRSRHHERPCLWETRHAGDEGAASLHPAPTGCAPSRATARRFPPTTWT